MFGKQTVAWGLTIILSSYIFLSAAVAVMAR
jgi:hypothetical protein